MRIALSAVLTFVMAFAAATSFAQAPAGAKVQGIFNPQPKSPKQAEQSSESIQQAVYAPAEEMPGVQQPPVAQPNGYPAGYGNAPYGYGPDGYCPPGGFGWGGHGGYGYAGHPGHLFNGGHYGYFGGAHRTPGYPHHHLHREYVGPQGPPTAQVAYPYYTIRGPRDFFLDNPPSIGR